MIRFFARHPTAGNLLTLIALILGGMGVLTLGRETMPELKPDTVEVSVTYAGATALEVEESICRPIETAIAGVSFLDEVRAEAREGRGSIKCVMKEGGEFSTFQGDLQRELDSLTTLPDDAEEPVVAAQGLEQKVLSIHVTAESSPRSIKAYCEDLSERLRRLPEVSLVDVEGFGDHQLRVELEPEALARFGLGPADVARVISAQSVDLPSGSIESTERDVLLRFVERRRTPAELEDLIIQGDGSGAEIRLRELGRVVDVFDDPWQRIEHEGVRAGRLVINKTRAEDSLTIADAVRAFVEEEQAIVPPGVTIVITEDSSDTLRGQISLVVTNGWQGMILVAISLWIFFSMRLALWVVMGLPVSILGACILMPAFGLTVNMLTLIGFLLALGLLMDDAIVIAENIATHHKSGKSAMQAAIDGVNEVKVGVFASFVTTICVLGPLTGISGDSGQRLRVIPIVLILVMAVSLIEAFWILPGHLGHALHHESPTQKQGFVRRLIDRGMKFLREYVVGRSVAIALKWRYVVVSAIVALLIACLGLLASGRIPFRAMPDLEGDSIVASILMPQGTPLEQTRRAVDRVLNGLEQMDAKWTPLQPDGQSLVRTWSVRYGQNTDSYESGAHVATISIDLLTAEEREGSSDEYIRDWRELSGELTDTLAVVFATPTGPDAGRPIELRFAGSDLEQLALATEDARGWLAQFDGARNLLADLRPSKPEFLISMNAGAFGRGIDAEGLARHVGAAFQGSKCDELQVGAEAYEISVRFAPGARNSKSDLEALRIPLPDGSEVPLRAVANIDEARGWARIARIDGQRVVTVRGDVDYTRGNAAAILGEFQAEYQPLLAERYPGITVSVAGEAEDSAETSSSMGSGMLFGLLGVFALLSLQFRSYLEPLVVMAAIPLSLIGVILGHLLLDFPFTLPSMLGFISLAGIVVNDSILLVEFVKLERAKGASILAAAAQASQSRFRAVLLTSSTTIAGLLPLLAESSLQAQIVKGLVISVAFGMIASTVLVLFIVPCLYAILGDLGWVTDVQTEESTA